MSTGGGGGRGGGGSGGNRRICFQWRDHGTCRFGISCIHAHIGSGGTAGNSSSNNWRQQQQGGRGSGGGGRSSRGGRGSGGGAGRSNGSGNGRGGGNGGGGRGGTMGSGPNRQQQGRLQQQHPDNATRNAIERFIQHLSVLSNSKLGTELMDETKSELWRNFWKRHSLLSKSTRLILVQVLARLPESANVPPPSMSDHVVPVVNQFIKEQTTTNSGTSSAEPDVILTHITTVRNVVKRCVQFEWPNGSQSSVKNGLETIILQAESSLLKQSKDHRQVASDLMQELEYLDKPWRIRIHESSIVPQQPSIDHANTDDIDESIIWKERPTIAWLKNARHFTPSSCPVMSRGGVYESSREYLATIHKLWTAMTFYDAHTACAPTCRARGSGAATSCGKVLWPVAAHGGNDGARSRLELLKCRRPNCTRPVDFCCSVDKSHDALCSSCASRTVTQRLGLPGAGSCTHIYDATIEAVHPDGFLQLENFKSRRPPDKPIHWRSTKRLASPNLVAIIKIPSRGAALQDSDAIRWGEVTTFGHSDFRQEGRLREQGKVKINIASIVSWNSAHDVEDEYPVATHVVIIDCMIFCPEWIPTLRALESMSRTRLPFEDGRHLNLCRTNPIVPVLLDINSSQNTTSSNSVMVETMLEASQLEPIREIRRSDLRSTLATRLVELMDDTTLDPMQCQAFLKALCNPVHLTQGPPGTGKSYLGVVLVRALIIIRELWLKTSGAAGAFPILVLSYKNHAIDEFLSDLVTSPSFRGSFGTGASPSRLIRIGGQCKDPRLAAYSERTAYEKDFQVSKCRATLQALQAIKASINTTLTSNVAFFLHYQHRIFASVDEQEAVRRQAAYEATDILMECIVRRQLLQQALVKLECDIESNSANNEDDKGNSRSGGRSCNEVAKTLSFLELIEDQSAAPGTTIASLVIKRHVSNPNGNSFISQLAEGMAHYDLDHWGDVLEKWITGVSPRPLCQFTTGSDESRCKVLAMAPNPPFCHEHRCRFQSSSTDDGNVERCSSSCAKEGVLYCRTHTCREDDCLSCRWAPVGEDYCLAHACRKCIEIGKVPAGLAMDDPPRNTCEDHPMCVTISCLNYCPGDGSSMYCPDHETVQCAATTKKGNICRGKALDRSFPYCKDHVHLVRQAQFQSSKTTPNVSATDLAAKESRNCRATNKKGNPCKGTTLPDRRYCYDHAALENGNGMASMAPKDAWCQAVSAEEETGGTKNVTTSSLEVLSRERKKSSSPAKVQSSEPKETELVDFPPPSSGKAEGKGDDDNSDEDKSESSDSFFSAEEENAPTEPDGKLQAVEADEMEWEDDGEENEHAVHLREVFEVNDGNSSDSDDDLSTENESHEVAEPNTEPDGATDENRAKWGASNSWSWDMSVTERWSACNFFMEALLYDLRKASSYAKSAAALARKELEKSKVLAKTRVYENKTVIGGTMVGCISRLEAIRASRPFAVLIEEASEVLEPLLFSCLSESTMTLQLVGDHRQLQPSVMDRFDFERRNKVNVSMFQRLIEAPSGHEIPSTVLSVQRRMRRNIADLTRSFYTDVTQIEDHESCATQVLGGKLPPGSANLAGMAATGGREIPGIGPHVFLWTHDGVQQRSDVGVSRVNKHEAAMACALVAYLVDCGVSRRSICVLTPYKGQLMLIRKMLLTDARYAPLRLICNNPQETDVCRLSTVDRFQGDEADIVICSLVVDEKSRTGFVKLVNRMVVLLSRARLGSYILGNVGYFRSNMPEHWAKTFTRLQSPAATDSDAVSPSEVFSGIRTGASIPLCCPLHRNITTEVATAEGLRTGFCTELCHHALVCGHECSLKCHWPADKHNAKCVQSIESPCGRHAGKLQCHHVFGNAVGAPFGTKNESIVKYYRCPTKVELQLPCGHSVLLACWEEASIVLGERPWPRCGKPSPIPYTFPWCGHTIPVSCHELDDFRMNPTHAQCERNEDYAPPCGHVKHMKCFMKEKYEKGDLVFTCSETEPTKLPRCGHVHKLRCGIGRGIETWSGRQCEEIGKVQEGVAYGPQDHNCNRLVTVSRLCGHDLKLPCNEAFLKSNSMQACRVLVDARNNCGHACKLACTDFRALDGAKIPEATAALKEGEIPPRATLIVNAPRCDNLVQFERRCGHVEQIQCNLVNKPLAGCEVDVDIESPFCRHKLKVPCRLKVPRSLWPDETYALIGQEGLLSKELIDGCTYSSIGDDLVQALKKCRLAMDVELQCGHVKTMKCCMLLDTLRQGRYDDTKCETTVTLALRCGHEMDIPCFQKRLYQAGRSSLTCTAMTVQDCWNHALCGKSFHVTCGFRGTPACRTKSLWTCREGGHTYSINHCTTGAPLNCPGCSMERLDAAVSQVREFNEAQEVRQVFREIPNVQWLHSAERNGSYFELEGELLLRYKGWLDSQRDIWARPVFKFHRIACFKVLKGNKEESLESFSSRVLVNQAFNGLHVIPLTAENLTHLSASSSSTTPLTLLVGFASVARTKTLDKDPVPKKRNGKRELMISLRKGFYDSLLFTDQKGYKSLIVWEPFPLIEVCKVKLTPDQLLTLLGNFSGSPLPDLAPTGIKYHPPPNGLVLSIPVENSPPDTVDDDDDSSQDDKASQDLRDRLVGTILEGFDIDLKWPGGISSDGAMNTGLENDLLQKMQFATPRAAPFSAIKMLRTLMESKNSHRILHLFLAAELVGRDQEVARRSLDMYLKESMAKGFLLLHPWALIVASRLATNSSRQLLSTYLQSFPLQERYLTREELDECRTMDAHSDGGIAASEGGDMLQQEWDQLKENYPHETRSDATEKLLNLIGLRKVKMEVLRLWKYALQIRVLDDESRRKNMITLNYAYMGNPGTGKTSVARLFSEILCDCGLRSNRNFVETNAQELKDGGSDEFHKTIQSAMGGVLFIDEAYDLDPIGDFKGKPIVNEILTLCENERDNISVVIAGYEDEFQKKFFAYNDGLKSRFKELMFDDFDENELGRIWTGMRKERLWEEDDGVCSVVVKRMVKTSGRKGFGNAREVRKRLEAATQTAMVRLGDRFEPETMRLEIEDVIGKDPRLESEKLAQVMDELEGKIGWSSVKKTVGELLELCSVNYQRELLGKKPFDLSLNRLFLGNPGTGKTSCARIYGRLLKEMGFLSHGDVVCKVASDFVGSVVGESQKKTSQIIEGARGKVLIIDEAYALDDNLYGAQVLDTLVERVQGTPADDIAVLLLGYEPDMLKMLKNQNPGLLRRFNPDYAFVFDDFTPNELLDILEANLKSYEARASIEFMEKALDLLQNQRLQANFGNAGAVDLLVKGAVQKAAKRLRGEKPGEGRLEACDIPGPSFGQRSEDPLSELDKLYKMEKVKEKLDGMSKRLEVSRREGDDSKISLHFVFRGSPGTGKTTVARALANILFGLQLKPSPKIVETTGLDLMADYVGQTSTKVTEKLKESKGGVLFIDEAYNLGVGTFGKEALDTLLAAMTNPDFEDVSIVIAGYPNELNQMMATNPGMKSRFTEFIEFEDWDGEDCAAFFKLCSSQKNFELDSGVVKAVQDGCNTIRSLDGWGNGRDVKQLWTDAKGLRDRRVYDTPNVGKIIALVDVQEAIQSMIQARIPGASFGSQSEDPLLELDKLYKMEKVKDTLDGMRKRLAVLRREGDDSKISLHFVFRGSPGTGKTTVARAIAKVLFGLKLKPSPKIVETTGLDLMADYVGQTSTKVTEKLKESKGGVLFIDEAYNLGSGTFGKEALDTLLAAMTNSDFEDVSIVIAGYPAELDEMMSSNPGLKSRFTDIFEFEDWDADDCVSFIVFLAEKKKFEFGADVKELICTGCDKLRTLPGWANGRDVAKLWTDMQGFRAQRVYEDTKAEATKTITSNDVNLAVEAMLNARSVQGRKRSHIDTTPPVSPLTSMNDYTYYARRGRRTSESQHQQEPQRQPPVTGIPSREQSVIFAPQKQEVEHSPCMGISQTRVQEAVPELHISQAQALEESIECQERTGGDRDTSGDGGEDNNNDDSIVVGRDDGVADKDWEELEKAKEKEKVRLDEVRRQQEEIERLLEEAKKVEEEARRKYEEELERLEKEKEREELERARRDAWEEEERRRKAAQEKRMQLEAEARQLQEEERKKQEMQRRLQQIRPCPAGYNWFRSGGGWTCGGGSHSVSDSELRQKFGGDM